MGPLKPRREGAAQTAVRVCLGGMRPPGPVAVPEPLTGTLTPSSTRELGHLLLVCVLWKNF